VDNRSIAVQFYLLLLKIMTDKQKKKLIKLNMKAESCLSRRKAQKVLKKADKVHQKVFAANF
jgi:hypothetical protein